MSVPTPKHEPFIPIRAPTPPLLRADVRAVFERV